MTAPAEATQVLAAFTRLRHHIPCPQGWEWHAVGQIKHHHAVRSGQPAFEGHFEYGDQIVVVYLIGEPS